MLASNDRKQPTMKQHPQKLYGDERRGFKTKQTQATQRNPKQTVSF